MPSGCDRVTMTHRATGCVTATVAPPICTTAPSSASSSPPSSTTLGRNRRTGRVPIVAADSRVTGMLSWKACAEPSNTLHESSDSAASGFS